MLNYMAQIQGQRKANLKLLLRQYESQRALSEAIGMSFQQVNHLLSGERAIGEVVARRIETALEKPPLWMDRDQETGKIIGSEGCVLSDREIALLSHYQRMTIRHREMLQETAQALIALEKNLEMLSE